MMPQPATILQTRTTKEAPWWEIAIIIALYLAIHFSFHRLDQIYILLVIIYLIVEDFLRHRTWADNGFGLRNILPGLKKTWGWCFLVAFGTQALFLFGGRFFLPEVFEYIIKRTPIDLTSLKPALFIAMAIATFEEEFLFRAVFQNRLSKWIAPAIAIGIVSCIFALAHFSSGSALVVGVHVISVFIDSVIFGIIFERSKNVFVAWIPHYVADIFATFLILALR
jgi:uncharacterized protein